MFNIVKKELKWGDETLVLETGKVARQAGGAVIASLGDTSVLCTVCAKKEAKEGQDFFPLTVHYQEKYYAAGKIPGGFFKREGRPTEKETLTSRLIDRPIRPLFPDSFFNEVQVICTVIAHDQKNDPDIVALVGASAALAISGVPFDGPIAATRIGYQDGKYLLNPNPAESGELDLVVAGTKDAVLMVESEAQELSEEVMLGAVSFGHKEMQPVIKLIQELADEAGKPAWEVEEEDNSDAAKKIAKLCEKELAKAYTVQDKQERVEKIAEIKKSVIDTLTEEAGEDGIDELLVNGLLKKIEKDIVRTKIIKEGVRIDGRDSKTVRQISVDVDAVPCTHGSALFTRGETQALVVTTLGSSTDEQIIDDLEGDRREHFMLHYNFPPYSVGEASMLRGASRREIGHGKLAWRAIHPLMPTKEEFPYTIRIVSEITESNGSSSMATVCGSSLSLMQAGIPLKRPVAGIAMGLIKEGKDFAVLSDILGDEDHLGDMDFKVAGTEEGITSLQMDIKINGITTEIMQIALDQAKDGRIHILGEMGKVIKESRETVNENAPTITSITIAKDKIREVIGSGGSVIRAICEESTAKVEIEDDGTVRIFATNKAACDKALEMVNEIIAEPEIGTIYDGTVMRVVDFGAFVRFLGKTEGLVHISEIENERIENINDFIKEGDTIKVKVIGMDRGKVRLSKRAVDQETGEATGNESTEEPKSKSGRGRGDKKDRGNDRGGDRNKGGKGRGNSSNKSGNSSDKQPEGDNQKKRRFF